MKIADIRHQLINFIVETSFLLMLIPDEGHIFTAGFSRRHDCNEISGWVQNVVNLLEKN
jgi:hypothetical protein